MDYVKHYVMLGEEQQGPLTIGQLKVMFKSGQVNPETRHYMDGYDEWHPLEFILEDLEEKEIPTPAQRATAGHQIQGMDYPPRSRGIYIILGIFLGCLGIHNFYAGRYAPGAFQLLITITIGWLIIPFLAVAFWALLELFIVRKDGRGKALI